LRLTALTLYTTDEPPFAVIERALDTIIHAQRGVGAVDDHLAGSIVMRV
jgi:hypothetical protein